MESLLRRWLLICVFVGKEVMYFKWICKSCNKNCKRGFVILKLRVNICYLERGG